MTDVASAGRRLREKFDTHGRLCVGIDPHSYLLSEWSLPDTAAGAREFGLRVVDAAADVVGIVKPQIAFFERFGSAGFAALEDVLSRAREAGLFVIGDVKRGDVGSTVDAYAAAWLSKGAALEVDAMTVSPFQGFDSLSGVIRAARRAGKGVFALCATSNPESGEVQRARTAHGETVSARLLSRAEETNAEAGDDGTVGVVLGATASLSEFGIDTTRSLRAFTPVLAPGFGHQGARIDDAAALFGRLSPGLIVTESRSLLSTGPDGLARAVRDRSQEVNRVFG